MKLVIVALLIVAVLAETPGPMDQKLIDHINTV